jgi:hypothetical protein
MTNPTLPFSAQGTASKLAEAIPGGGGQAAFIIAVTDGGASPIYGAAPPSNLGPNYAGIWGRGSVGVQGDALAGGPDTIMGVWGTGNGANGVGVQGSSDSGIAVNGFTDDGTGVQGTSTNGVGISGQSYSAIAVQGESTQADAVNGLSHSNVHAGVAGHNDGGGPGVWAIGSPAGYFVGDVQCTGTMRAAVITPGGDCAEDFEVGSADEVEPGTVMVVDNTGALRPSEQAYDKRVAGVISGAGDYRPGLILGRSGTVASGMPLALVGKVYCKVDAQYDPVEVGDLLTTSPTPGHAMRASDPGRAFGSVIGKALGGCRSGQALVPMLIALQ